MKLKKSFLLAPILFTLASCNFLNRVVPIDNAEEHIEDKGITDETNGEEIEVTVNDDEEVTLTDSASITDLSVSGISYDESKKLFTITSSGEFVFTGEFNGNILVNAGEEDEVKITLNGFNIKSTTDSPIKCDQASLLQISLKSGTKNYIYDYREAKTTDDDTQGNGAITSSCDMKVTGKGSLNIVARYNNGLHSKDDLTLKPEVKITLQFKLKHITTL